MLNLKDIREENGLQQKDIAKKLNRTPACISSWETGKTEPSLDDLIKLADYLEVSVDYLLGRTNEAGIIEETKTLSPLHKRMLDLFDRISPEDRLQVLGFIQAFIH